MTPSSTQATKKGSEGPGAGPLEVYLRRGDQCARLYGRRPVSILPGMHPGEVKLSLQPVLKGQVVAWSPLWERWVLVEQLEAELDALLASGWEVTGRQKFDQKAFGMLGAATVHGVSMGKKVALDQETLGLVSEVEALKPLAPALGRAATVKAVEPLVTITRRPRKKKEQEPKAEPAQTFTDAWKVEEARRRKTAVALRRQKDGFSDMSPGDQERVRRAFANEQARQLAFDLQWGLKQAAG